MPSRPNVLNAVPARGETLPLSVPRKVVCDLLHIAQRVPTVPVQRVVDLSCLTDLRKAGEQTIGWCTIFTKAYAQVAMEIPALRRAYLEYPRPRLYQHPCNAASVAISRDYGGEPAVFFGYIPRPENVPLVELEAAIRWYRQAPIEDAFSFTLNFYRLPRFLRRIAWWYLMNVRGSRKAEFLGTFGVSVYSHLGAESLHPLSPLTTVMNYGVIGADHRVSVRLVYDHRVLDGGSVAKALVRLEEVLQTTIRQELIDLRNSAARSAVASSLHATEPVGVS